MSNFAAMLAAMDTGEDGHSTGESEGTEGGVTTCVAERTVAFSEGDFLIVDTAARLSLFCGGRIGTGGLRLCVEDVTSPHTNCGLKSHDTKDSLFKSGYAYLRAPGAKRTVYGASSVELSRVPSHLAKVIMRTRQEEENLRRKSRSFQTSSKEICGGGSTCCRRFCS